MSSQSTTGKPEEDASTISDGSNSRGSSHHHHLGTAVSGAMHKLSSPIVGIRKAIRKDSDYSHTPRSTERKTKSFDFNDRSSHHHPMKDVSDFFGESGKAVKRLVHRNKDASSRSIPVSDDEEQESELPAVPPDETLSKMNIIISSKCLKGVSISNYYETVWNEHSSDDKEPLYRSFLEESGKENIIVGEWETAEDGNDFVGDWDGEKYTQKRTVTFVFDKKVPFQSKPVLAQVTQTHYCRMEGNARCVVAMTIDMQNVPFSDCFNVELRWVASRSETGCVVQVGLFVNFIKSTMLAGKIRNGTTQQTTQQQMQLFDKVLEACGATAEEVSQDEDAAPYPPLPAVKLTQDDAGRILVLSGCLLGVASQADCLCHQSSCDTAQTQVSSTAITSILAGLILLLPQACWLTEVPCLVVVVAHLANGLCNSVISECGIITSLSTVFLMVAWSILAWGVWQKGALLKGTS